MRLLNTRTLELQEFVGDRIPSYAILSHTWGDEEVSFQDLSRPDLYHSALVGKKGFQKIVQCCQQAAMDGYCWVWIDTCCIDKSSSAELSEAINSMYKWYEHSSVCYAYLSDVPPLSADGRLGAHSFAASRWFTRGWTLQELIAPRYVEFYSRTWTEIGTKRSLEELLRDVTGISNRVLRGGPPYSDSVAERMSWAAGRETAREEDKAYCLLGLFQINMPMLYGEGSRAFRRLQEEILKQVDDLTILSWWPISPSSEPGGILANSPDDFGKSAFRINQAEALKNEGTEAYLPAVPFCWSHVKFLSPALTEEEANLLQVFGESEVHRDAIQQWTESGIFGPPYITNRGLRITLLARQPETLPCNDKAQLMAWTFCTWGSARICLRLIQLGPAWVRTGEIVLLPKSALADFRPRQLYLSLLSTGGATPDPSRQMTNFCKEPIVVAGLGIDDSRCPGQGNGCMSLSLPKAGFRVHLLSAISSASEHVRCVSFTEIRDPHFLAHSPQKAIPLHEDSIPSHFIKLHVSRSLDDRAGDSTQDIHVMLGLTGRNKWCAISTGQPFHPDEQQRKRLTDRAKLVLGPDAILSVKIKAGEHSLPHSTLGPRRCEDVVIVWLEVVRGGGI